MFDLALPRAALKGAYPEREWPRDGWLDRFARGLIAPGERLRKARAPFGGDFVGRVNREARAVRDLDLEGLRAQADDLRDVFRREGMHPDLVARSFALVRETSDRVLGMRHFDVQLMGGWIMMHGMIAEMETGEGKTLTATLAATTAALAGIPVHVVTVNDYLTKRDAEQMGKVYGALGISVGTVIAGQQPPQRRAAYACDITYCTNKELTFDYLRDRLALGDRASQAKLRVQRLAGAKGAAATVLRGLYFAIVDEADSVLVDEARTPLIIAAQSDTGVEAEICRAALREAAELTPERDFILDIRERTVRLTDAGKAALEAVADQLPPALAGSRRREELVSQALVAIHMFERDKHYVVREGKVDIVDEYTGRTMADRKWEQGLHQMIEAKEGVELTAPQASVARLTYQKFFRRYLWISGMTGTASEVAGELWSVYKLPVARVPTNRPVQRADLGVVVCATLDEKWRRVAERVRALSADGRAVLIGTRSVAASQSLSVALARENIAHDVLNALQDEREADIVAQAGQPGRVTVATNMAGRGTDIKLHPAVLATGGLHVIGTEFHDSGRIDRQLWGRGARQGDPGSYEMIVSLEDELLTHHLDPVTLSLARTSQVGKGGSATWAFREAQRRAERHHAAIRKDLLTMDDRLGDLLAFSGRGN